MKGTTRVTKGGKREVMRIENESKTSSVIAPSPPMTCIREGKGCKMEKGRKGRKRWTKRDKQYGGRKR